jgi:hypothetical protein
MRQQNRPWPDQDSDTLTGCAFALILLLALIALLWAGWWYIKHAGQ